MDSIIKTIVDMDKRARKRTMEEQEFFDRADSELAEQAKKLQAEEQERADSEIAKTASEYDAKLKEALAAIDKKPVPCPMRLMCRANRTAQNGRRCLQTERLTPTDKIF